MLASWPVAVAFDTVEATRRISPGAKGSGGDPPDREPRNRGMNGIALACDRSLFPPAGRPRLGAWTSAMSAPQDPAPENAAALILAIAARNDRAAFAALFERFAPRVKSYMLRLGATPEAAEELAQEAMLTVWRKAALFDPARAGASTWIFAIARNLRIDAIRRERRPRIEDDPTDEPPPEPAADAVIAAAERDVRLRSAMAALPKEQAEVIRLSFFHDKPHSEIAADLRLPLGTVKSRLRLALGRLRSLVGDLA